MKKFYTNARKKKKNKGVKVIKIKLGSLFTPRSAKFSAKYEQDTKPTEHSGLRQEFGYIVLRIISRPVGRLG